MTSAAIADCHTMLAAACALPEKIRLAVVSPTSGYNTLNNTTYQEGRKGDFKAEAIAAANDHRALVVGSISDEIVKRLLDPVLLTYGVAINSPWSDPTLILDDLYDRFVASGLTVNSKVITYGTVAAGGANVGNGTIRRVHIDKNGKKIESCTSELVTIKCKKDVLIGGATKHEEVFEIRSEPAGDDAGFERGAGLVTPMKALSARDSSRNGVRNPSFSQITPTTSGSVLTTLTGWTVSGSISNIQCRTSSGFIYRDSQGDTSPKAIAFTANVAIYQSMANLRSDVPYLVQVAYKPVSCDGKLHMIAGDQSVSATLSGASGWNLLQIPLSQACWAERFNTTSPLLKLKMTSNGTGSLNLDDVVVGPMTAHDSLFYAAVGGQTKFLVDDQFTFSNAETGAIVQRWLGRAYRKYLPATNSSPTVTDPTVA